MKKYKQIRFARPTPQQYINDLFLRGSKADKTIFVYIDNGFGKNPDTVRPGKLIPCDYELGKQYIKGGYKIINDTLKKLDTFNWEIIIETDIGKSNYKKILNKYTKKEITVSKNFNNMVKKTRSLLMFVPSTSNNFLYVDYINIYLKYNKPICVVNEYGVKRYPRK